MLLYAEVALTMVPKKQTSEMLSECNFGLKIYPTDVPVDAELSSNTSEGSVKPISVCIVRDKLLWHAGSTTPTQIAKERTKCRF